MDVIEIERAFTDWAAAVLGLAVDNGIYRGGVPAGVETGVGVMLNAEIKTSDLRHRTWNAQILGKFMDRDAALRMIAQINGAVPVHGVTVSGQMFAAILPRGGGDYYTAADMGRIKTFASCNLLVLALTTGAQVVAEVIPEPEPEEEQPQ